LKINKKKFIYLISPNRITKNFYKNLKLVFKTNKVSIFQMRLKKYSMNQKMIIGKKIKNICKVNKVYFLVNDDPWLAKKLDADGCHLGQNDMKIKEARDILGNKIIGITCHNSIKLAKIAIKSNPNYLAFGAFNKTKTKKTKYQATTKIL
jgi:thiamine-phosphate pyrophosphorylase